MKIRNIWEVIHFRSMQIIIGIVMCGSVINSNLKIEVFNFFNIIKNLNYV